MGGRGKAAAVCRGGKTDAAKWWPLRPSGLAGQAHGQGERVMRRYSHAERKSRIYLKRSLRHTHVTKTMWQERTAAQLTRGGAK